MVAERIHRRSHRDRRNHRHNWGEVLVRNLVRIAMEGSVGLGKDEGEIRIANLVSHICVRFSFLKDWAKRGVEGESSRGGWWSVRRRDPRCV